MDSIIRYKCKLCFKCFPNGRALGGHMRSHMMNLQVPLKQEFAHQTVMSCENESASSASYSDDEESGNLLSYGLRENPKKSFRLVDPEFMDAGSVVVQDRESETETSMKLTRRRRSKRTRKSSTLVFKNHEQAPLDDVVDEKDDQLKRLTCAEPEPVSSISDATTEEDIAYCLMMLSRDKWKENQVLYNYEDQEDGDEYDDYDDDETEESEEQKMSSKSRSRGKYKCETCNKVFRSYQALGGHRASHKKIKVSTTTQALEKVKNAASLYSSVVSEKKIHECPFCSRVFNSGQALGGHKRSHFTNGGGGVLASATRVATASTTTTTKFGEHLIDLNLPAPTDDDDDDDEFSQVDISAVSDAEFINPIKD